MPLLTEDALARIQRFVEKYPDRRSALLPALHIAQNEVGWLPREAMEEVAQALGLDWDQVEEVASFYTMYYKQPVGRYVLEVCKTIPCSLMGADEIIEHISERLGISPGETSEDGMFTLLRVECLAACHRAPAMQLNHRYVQDLTVEKIDALIEAARGQQLVVEGAPGFHVRRTWTEDVRTES